MPDNGDIVLRDSQREWPERSRRGVGEGKGNTA